MNLEDRLRKVEAAEEIRILKADYCDLCDAGYPADELCALFTDDGVWDGAEMGVFEGRDALHRFFTNMPNVMSFAIHHVTNSAVEVSDDASFARGRWYLLQTATVKASDEAVWLAAHYDDEIVATDAGWRFKRVQLRSRFYTSHKAGWAKVPHLLEQS
jgi:ketosteroid isomerase-like protein